MYNLRNLLAVYIWMILWWPICKETFFQFLQSKLRNWIILDLEKIVEQFASDCEVLSLCCVHCEIHSFSYSDALIFRFEDSTYKNVFDPILDDM